MHKISLALYKFSYTVAKHVNILVSNKSYGKFYKKPIVYIIAQLFSFSFVVIVTITNSQQFSQSVDVSVNRILTFITTLALTCFYVMHLVGIFHSNCIVQLLQHQLTFHQTFPPSFNSSYTPKTNFLSIIVDLFVVATILSGFGVVALMFSIQIGIYYSGLCILPFNSLQVAFTFGTEEGKCNRSSTPPLITLFSFLFDAFGIQGFIPYGIFVTCNVLACGAVFLLKELCLLHR